MPMLQANPPSILRRVLPVFRWLPAYQRTWLVPDVLAGFAVWAVMVPEGMAYAEIVGVPPIMGLYTIVPPLVAYALLGTSAPVGGWPGHCDRLDLCVNSGRCRRTRNDGFQHTHLEPCHLDRRLFL